MDQPQEIKTRKHFSVLKWVLILSIMIVLNLFFNFGISSFYHEPKYEDFCKAEQVDIQPTTKDECVAKGGQWTESINSKPIPVAEPTTPRKVDVYSSCDVDFTCRKDFQTANDVYTRNVFIALVILGIASIIAGFIVSSSAVVSLGLSLGGILSLVIASIRYWSSMNEFIRVIILGLALVVLIWIGVKKFRE